MLRLQVPDLASTVEGDGEEPADEVELRKLNLPVPDDQGVAVVRRREQKVDDLPIELLSIEVTYLLTAAASSTSLPRRNP